jgi:hypothetical protein
MVDRLAVICFVQFLVEAQQQYAEWERGMLDFQALLDELQHCEALGQAGVDRVVSE